MDITGGAVESKDGRIGILGTFASSPSVAVYDFEMINADKDFLIWYMTEKCKEDLVEVLETRAELDADGRWRVKMRVKSGRGII